VKALRLMATLIASGAIAATATADATTSQTSLPAVERRVMCVTCKIPLNVAESVQADRERAYIRGLITEGDTESQVERALVGQYGPAVLGLPSAHGFDLTAYLVPVAAMLALLATLALLLPRWRKRARTQAAGGDAADATTPVLTPAESARLDADLARFER
jgi:cytochrome c-type biogenesis protein CcmH